MKIKLIDSGFDKETHKSFAVIQTRYGIFRGECVTDPEDYDIEDRYTGCMYAERKAEIKAMKARLEILRIRKDAYAGLCSDLYWTSDDDDETNSYAYNRAFLFLDRTTAEYLKYRDLIELAKESLHTDMMNRRSKIEEAKQKSKRKVRWVDLGEIDLEKLKKTKE